MKAGRKDAVPRRGDRALRRCGIPQHNPSSPSDFRVPMPDTLSTTDKAELAAELARLREEHRDLNDAIAALETVGPTDQLQIQRLKRRKLLLKDRIGALEDQLTPDIIA